MTLSIKAIRNIGFVTLVALAMFARANAVQASQCDVYCGDGICQDGGCTSCGCDLPGNGCVEKTANCPEDCPGQ